MLLRGLRVERVFHTMKSLVRWSVAGLAALLMGGATMAAQAQNHGPIPWTTSLSAAQKTAAKEKKVILVDFTASWCGPCQQMLKTTYQDKGVVTDAKGFVPVLVDVDKQKQVAAKYKVTSIPTILFLDAKGKILGQTVGYTDAAQLRKLMNEAKSKAKS